MLGFSKFQTIKGQYNSLAALSGVQNPAGSEGATVSVAVSLVDQYGTGLLPIGNPGQNYAVTVTPSQPCFITVSNKGPTGFTVNLVPSGAGVAISAGSFDCILIG
jgi:hypothetical protein